MVEYRTERTVLMRKGREKLYKCRRVVVGYDDWITCAGKERRQAIGVKYEGRRPDKISGKLLRITEHL